MRWSALLLMLAACDATPREAPSWTVDTSSDLAPSETVVAPPGEDETCSVECFDDGDCGNGAKCVNTTNEEYERTTARCEVVETTYQPPGQPLPFDQARVLTGACRGDDDCSVRRRCSTGRVRRACRVPCVRDDQCWAGLFCVEGACVGCSPERRETCPNNALCRVYPYVQDYGFCLASCDSDDQCSGTFCVGPDGE